MTLDLWDWEWSDIEDLFGVKHSTPEARARFRDAVTRTDEIINNHRRVRIQRRRALTATFNRAKLHQPPSGDDHE